MTRIASAPRRRDEADPGTFQIFIAEDGTFSLLGSKRQIQQFLADLGGAQIAVTNVHRSRCG
jgi:hypothetical protein